MDWSLCSLVYTEEGELIPCQRERERVRDSAIFSDDYKGVFPHP